MTETVVFVIESIINERMDLLSDELSIEAVRLNMVDMEMAACG